MFSCAGADSRWSDYFNYYTRYTIAFLEEIKVVWFEFAPHPRTTHSYSTPAHVATSDESGRTDRPLRHLKRAPPPRRDREPSRSTTP